MPASRIAALTAFSPALISAAIPEADAIAALEQFPQLWEQLFPGEQARIIQLLVRRITVTAEGLVIDLRTDGIAGVMREMMTPRPVEAAE